MLTKVREPQLDLPSLRALIQEVEEARGGFPTLKARLDALVGSGGGGSEIGYATSGVTEERLDLLASIVRAANHARSEYYVGKTLVVDPLTDLSGIDISLSSGYIWQSQRIQQAPRIPDWVEFDAPEKPPARNGHSLTFDPIRGRVVLFGGWNGSALNDTWEYDGTNWIRITTPTSPSARYGHSLTFDPIRGRVILFGGDTGSTRLNDTWEYWDNIDPAEVVSSADELELPPSQVYFVPHIPDDAPLSNIEYYMSLDGGQTWFPIKPEELMSVSGGINISNPPLIRVKAIIPSGGRLSGWAYGWV